MVASIEKFRLMLHSSGIFWHTERKILQFSNLGYDFYEKLESKRNTSKVLLDIKDDDIR